MGPRRLAALVEGSYDLVAVFDDQGRFVYASSSHARVLGFDAGVLLGESATDFVHPDDVEWVTGAFAAQMMRGDTTVPVAYRHRHADGSWRWLEAIAVDRRDDGVVGGIVTYTRDVTERRAAEDARRASEEQFRALLASAPIGIVQCDQRWAPIRCNARFAEIAGRPEADLLGPPRRWLELIHPGDHGALRAERLAAERESREVRAECRILRPDGQTRWVQVRAVATRGDDGAPSGYISTFDDITTRRHMEAALQDSEARFRAAFEHAPIGIALADRDGKILESNQAFADILGRGRAELAGMAIRAFTYDDDWADNERLMRRLFAGELDTYGLEKRYVHADGHPVWVALRVSVVRAPDGEPRYMIGQIQDITDTKAAYEILARQARHDPLTGLANRAHMHDHLERLGAQPRRGGKVAAVLFADLDHFKDLNDCYGHHSGDQVLIEVGRRLRVELRPADLVCRLGGDEFIIISEQLQDVDAACDLARRVLAIVRRPFHLDGQPLVGITTSIGVSLIEATNPDAALRAADAAMYAAKQSGRDRISVAAASKAKPANKSGRPTVRR